MLRAITIPVAGPVGIEWAALRPKLRDAFAAATAAANWTIRELSRADHVRTPDSGAKMPPMDRLYLYPGARAAVPAMDPQSVTCILQAVERKWRSSRLDVVWRRAAAPPSYRYPTPYPMHEASWSIECEPGGAVIASVRLLGERIGLRLRGGHDFRRQCDALRKVASGEYPHGEATLIERAVSESSHRAESGSATRLMFRACVWLPRGTTPDAEGTLYVRTGVNALLTYRVDAGEPRYLHADQARRWCVEHTERMARIAHDAKHEKRWPADVRRGMADRREAWSTKHHDRIDTLCHQAAAMIAGYAHRRKVARVEYDDTDRSYLGVFAWHRLAGLLREKIESHGIEFAAVVPQEDAQDAVRA